MPNLIWRLAKKKKKKGNGSVFVRNTGFPLFGVLFGRRKIEILFLMLVAYGPLVQPGKSV